MIGKIIHNFRIISEIGEGGMGVVYLAEHLEVSPNDLPSKAFPNR